MSTIILEGLDNVGKTTQINNIREEFNSSFFLTFHLSNIKTKKWSNEAYQSYFKNLYVEYFELIESNEYDLLFDRFHLGESVYSPLYRNYSGDYVFELEKIIENCNEVYLIVLIDEAKNLLNREDGNSFTIELEKKQQEIDLFIEAFKKSSIKNKILININNKNQQQVFKEIKDFIK